MDKKKNPNILYYRKSEFGYWISTHSIDVVQYLRQKGIKLSSENNGQYTGVVSELPRGKFKRVPYQVKPPTRKRQRDLEKIYEVYLRKSRALDDLQADLDIIESRIHRFLVANGLRLKPNCEQDCQLLSIKHRTRLHLQESWRQSIRQDVLEQLMGRYPILKKCVVVQTRKILDRKKLQRALPKLSPSVINKIVSFEKTLSFAQTKLSNPECPYCGGKRYRDGRCRRCGLI